MKRFSILLALMLLAGPTFANGEGRGYLGVMISAVDNIGEGSKQNGIYIESVLHGSGAEAAGLKPKDRVLSLNSFAIRDMDDLEAQLKVTRPGDTVDVVVLRSGRQESFQVVLGGPSDMKRQFKLDRGKYLVELQAAPPRMGMQLQELGPQLSRFFEVDGGVLITSVSEGSAAQHAGLRAGDIILELAGHTITIKNDVSTALAGRKEGQTVEIAVQSRGRLEVLAITLEEAMDDEKMIAFLVQGRVQRPSDNDSRMTQLEVPGSWSLKLMQEENRADTIQLKIYKLEQELKRLNEQLEREAND